MTEPSEGRVLFLCTGNYYRSRFAEILFNHLAEARGSGWRAFSRGLRLHPGNVGSIAVATLAALAERGVPPGAERVPQAVTEADFDAADRVIAAKEAEHRPMVEALFPHRAGEVEYWHVHDLPFAEPESALGELDAHVRALLDALEPPQDGSVKAT